MKRSLIAGSVIVLLMLVFAACEEVGPSINLRDNQFIVGDTTYIESPVATAETKNVLLEEFTGVRCPNCPQGHELLANLKTQYGSRVVSISMHPKNSLGLRYPFSPYDFVNLKAQDLFINFFSQTAEPCAAIDRILFTGESLILVDKSKWQGYVNQQITKSTPVNLLLSSGFDSATRQATITVEAHYTENVATQNKITIALVESGMVSPQLDGLEVDTFYTHNDVLRDFITNTRGDIIDTTLQPGRVVRRIYKTTIDSTWVPANMHVVGYVHNALEPKMVYQVKEVKLK